VGHPCDVTRAGLSHTGPESTEDAGSSGFHSRPSSPTGFGENAFITNVESVMVVVRNNTKPADATYFSYPCSLVGTEGGSGSNPYKHNKTATGKVLAVRNAASAAPTSSKEILRCRITVSSVTRAAPRNPHSTCIWPNVTCSLPVEKTGLPVQTRLDRHHRTLQTRRQSASWSTGMILTRTNPPPNWRASLRVRRRRTRRSRPLLRQ
jgi:hypothetical protein